MRTHLIEYRSHYVSSNLCASYECSHKKTYLKLHNKTKKIAIDRDKTKDVM